MSRRYFGTDGVRGRVGEFPITPEFMLKLGWAAGCVLADGDRRKVLIGKDTRISGYMFESALEAGLSAAGVDIALLGPMPTPAIAYLTRTLHASAGIVISASHNPFHDNGIKFFSARGYKLPDEVELAIEAKLDDALVTVDAERLGKAHRVVDAAGRYIEFCKSTVGGQLNLSGMTIVVDCAHGATYHVAPSVLAELGARVIPLHTAPDGLNINRHCGSTHLQPLIAAVVEQQADLGIAFDGDGDRLMMVDRSGGVADGDDLLYIIARDRRFRGHPIHAVVGTQMSNLGFEQALLGLDIRLHRAQVGDRYVMERMVSENVDLGGENSGHIICLDKTTTGDGIVSALQVLAAICRSERTLAELRAGVSKFPQILINVPMIDKQAWRDNPVLQAGVRRSEAVLAGRGRVLLRSSGTEPILRVMVEGEQEAHVRQIAEELADLVRQTCGRS